MSKSLDDLAARGIKVADRSCSGCDLCCEAMEIKSLAKPHMQRCPHQRFPGLGAGCNIYEARPDDCREFYCMWRIVEMIPRHWKPADVGFVLAALDTNIDPLVITAHVDPKRPDAWEAERVGLRNLAINCMAIVAIGGGDTAQTLFGPNGSTFTRKRHPWLFQGGSIAVPEEEFKRARAARPDVWKRQKALIAERGGRPALAVTVDPSVFNRRD